MQVRRIKDWAPDDTLEHHGIKGQRWGVRHYQNPDGSLTAAGKSRYLRQTSKDINKIAKLSSSNKETQFDASRNVAKYLNENSGYKQLDTYKDYKKKRDEYIDYSVNGGFKEYYDTPQHDKDSKKAYEATVEYFKKEEPEYFQKILKDNKGSTKNLDAYHDFRKVLDGYQDEYWSKGEEDYIKKNQKSYDTLTKLETDYVKAQRKLAKDLCGLYGNKSIKYVAGWYIQDHTRESLKNITYSAINELEHLEYEKRNKR